MRFLYFTRCDCVKILYIFFLFCSFRSKNRNGLRKLSDYQNTNKFLYIKKYFSTEYSKGKLFCHLLLYSTSINWSKICVIFLGVIYTIMLYEVTIYERNFWGAHNHSRSSSLKKKWDSLGRRCSKLCFIYCHSAPSL